MDFCGYKMKKVITDSGRQELERLDFDIDSSIDKILKYVPISDTKGISKIIITDLPKKENSSNNNKTLAAYMRKYNNEFARIEVYLKNLYAHIQSNESFNLMLPIQEFGLANALFHEFGHHFRIIKSHGIPKGKSEKFATQYSEKLQKSYVLDNAKVIDDCFDDLENIAKNGRMSIDIVQNMRRGWEQFCKKKDRD